MITCCSLPVAHCHHVLFSRGAPPPPASRPVPTGVSSEGVQAGLPCPCPLSGEESSCTLTAARRAGCVDACGLCVPHAWAVAEACRLSRRRPPLSTDPGCPPSPGEPASSRSQSPGPLSPSPARVSGPPVPSAPHAPGAPAPSAPCLPGSPVPSALHPFRFSVPSALRPPRSPVPWSL